MPAHFRDPDDLWLGTNVHLLVILQKRKLLPPIRARRLSRPDETGMEGQDRFTDPANSGSAYSNLTMLAQLWGSNDAACEKGFGAARQHQGAQPFEPRVPGRRQREFPLGMSLEYAGYQWSSNGAPVKVIYPADGTIAQMEGVAVIKGGRTPRTQLFVDYVSRKDVREAILRFAFRRPARQDLDLQAPGAMPQLSDVKLIDYDEDAWVENGSRPP